MWHPPGETRTRPGSSRSPSRASRAEKAVKRSMRSAKLAVKPPGMCCDTTTAKGGGSVKAPSTWVTAAGPPVDAQIATTRRAAGLPGAGRGRGLRDEVHRAEVERLEDVLGVRPPADHEHRRRPPREQQAQEREAVHVRHLEVEGHEGALLLQGLAQRDR